MGNFKIFMVSILFVSNVTLCATNGSLIVNVGREPARGHVMSGSGFKKPGALKKLESEETVEFLKAQVAKSVKIDAVAALKALEISKRAEIENSILSFVSSCENKQLYFQRERRREDCETIILACVNLVGIVWMQFGVFPYLGLTNGYL